RRAWASGDPAALRARRRPAPHARPDRQAVRSVARTGSPNRARGNGQVAQRRARRPAALIRKLTTHPAPKSMPVAPAAGILLRWSVSEPLAQLGKETQAPLGGRDGRPGVYHRNL